MTEIKGLTAQELDVPDDAKEFLTSPYRKKLMIEFVIGNNTSKMSSPVTQGLQFYGQPFTMAKYSELIKTNIPNIADSSPPHPLLTFGTVLERPMSILWLMMNGFDLAVHGQDMSGHTLIVKGLNSTELLHMYRLANYFGIDSELTFLITGEVLKVLSEEKDISKLSDNDKKSIESILSSSSMPYGLFLPVFLGLYRVGKLLNIDSKYISIIRFHLIDQFSTNWAGGEIKDQEDQKLVAAALNDFFAQPEKIEWKAFLEGINTEDEIKNMPEANIQDKVLDLIFEELNKQPTIKQLINYIPVYIGNAIGTYAERKAPVNDLGKLNKNWIQEGGTFLKGSVGHGVYVELAMTKWGPDSIVFSIVEEESMEELLEDGPLLKPIIT
jgi:hypothetical protein